MNTFWFSWERFKFHQTKKIMIIHGVIMIIIWITVLKILNQMNRILKILFYSFINTIYIWETLKGKVQLNLLETINTSK